MDTSIYDTTLPFPRARRRDWTEADREMADAYDKDRRAKHEQFKADLRKELKCEELTDADWELLFRLAWESGHSSGFSEVAIYADDLAELALAVRKSTLEQKAPA